MQNAVTEGEEIIIHKEMSSFDATKDARALHWVLKIGSLKQSMAFYEHVLGLRVLRHEEFESGCEATCNGPYGGAWSKTMIGYGPEHSNFALELTYNYGIEGYAFGNDLQYIAVANPSALVRAASLGYNVQGNVIQGPDSYRYKVLPRVPGRAENFLVVALRVANLARAVGYWRDVLGMREVPLPPGLESHGPNGVLNPSTVLSFGEDGEQAMLQLVEVQDGQAVDHALSSGRIAFACKAVAPIHAAAVAAGEKVLTPPLRLPTPGKADVVVTILADRDNYEICFVEGTSRCSVLSPHLHHA
jgi:catechol 2,3-dioxygenase-like lactoylglutathione lyase family enzyme